MMKNKKCVVFGSNVGTEVISFLLNKDSEYSVEGYCISKEYRDQDSFNGKPLVDFETVESVFPPDEYEMYVLASYGDQNRIRERFYWEAKKKGYQLLTYISSKATNYSEEIGDNVFIFEDNTIQPFVKIMSNVIIWSGNHIGHHSLIEDNVFISSHVVVSGGCKIGKNSFLGVNSTIRDGIKIGSYCTLGAGCLIVKDTPEGKVFIGQKATEFDKNN